MANSLKDLLSGPILDFFRVGQRRILLFPVLGIPIWWTIVASLRGLTARGVIGDPYFLTGSGAIVAICCGVYLYRTRSPARDYFHIVVANFHAVGGRKARTEAVTIRDRLVEELRARSLNHETRVRIHVSSEVVDGRTAEGRQRAEDIAREYRAHMVLGGTIRIDEEYLLEPFIVTRFSHPFEVSLRDSRPAIIQPGQSLSLKRQKVSFEGGLAAFISALASIDAERYAQADQILATLADLGAPAWFYRGFSLLQLQKPQEAFDCFKIAYTLDESFADAWLYAAFALHALGERKLAKTHLQEASARTGGVSLSHMRLRVDAIRRMNDILIAELEDIAAEFHHIAELERSLKEGAIETLRSTGSQEFYADGFKLLREKQYEAAVDRLSKATDLDPDNSPAWLEQAMALARLDLADQARTALRRAEVAEVARAKSGFYTVDARSQAHRDYSIAIVYAIIGDGAPMLACLRRAIQADPLYRVFAKNEADFAEYRNDDEFRSLLVDPNPPSAELPVP
jgi:tetratricopeptide (TPR) repeat protein